MAKIFKALAVLVVLGFGLAVLTGCPDTVDRRPTVTVTALGDTDLIGGESLGFEATVGGWMPESVDNSIVWSIVEQGTHGGTFLDGNVLTVSPLERHLRLTVRASLEVDPSIFGQVAVSITPPDPVITGLTLTAMHELVARGGSVVFAATVEGLHNPPTFMEWEMVTQGTHANTTLVGGLVTVALEEPNPTITVRATSVFDPNFYAEDTITLFDLPAGMRFVAAGDSHTVAIAEDGSLWAWGNNADGRTGLGTDEGVTLLPKQVGTDTDWVYVAAGSQHTLAIRENGTLWAWGSNANGVTALGTTAGHNTAPVQVGSVTTWRSVSTSAAHTMVVRTDDTLWGVGVANNGRLGLGVNVTGTTSNFMQSFGGAEGLTGNHWASVSVGTAFTVAIRTDGTLWSWGANANGRTGLGTAAGDTFAPTQIGDLADWAYISAGPAHAMAIRTDGTLWSWGANANGRTGLGTAAGNTTSPTQVGSATNWRSVSAANEHTMAIRTDDTLWATGNVADGRTGLLDGVATGSVNSFTQSLDGWGPGLTGTSWASVSSGNAHTVGIRTDGTLWAWGSNGEGRLGDGTTTQRISPMQIIPIP